jgi:TetR/AcrR family transcriptional regulator, regulator of cefoperazone and chloramphenicol sensitivity
MPAKAPGITQQTRARILECAGELFAEKGYEAVTVREICARAGANIAAVNYHFGNKQSLYFEVVKSIAAFARQARIESRSGPAEARFRQFISQYVRGLLSADRPGWVLRLMQREMTNPSPALKYIVDTVIRSTEQHLRKIIRALAGPGPSDESIRLCAHSVIGQCLHYKHATAVFAHLWPDFSEDPKRLDKLVDHIAAFSLDGIRCLASKRAGPQTKVKEHRKDG